MYRITFRLQPSYHTSERYTAGEPGGHRSRFLQEEGQPGTCFLSRLLQEESDQEERPGRGASTLCPQVANAQPRDFWPVWPGGAGAARHPGGGGQRPGAAAGQAQALPAASRAGAQHQAPAYD